MILFLLLNSIRSIILTLYLYYKHKNEIYNYKLNELNNDFNMEIECSICLDIIKNKYSKTFCNHIFHNECIYKWLRKKDTCPICREIIKDINSD